MSTLQEQSKRENGENAAGLPPEPETSQLSAFCPFYHHAMNIIGRRWMGAVVRVLLNGPRRFNEILSAIPGISDRLLTERLRELEAEGLVIRHVLPASPVRVEYELTEAGQELETAIRVISAWAEKWITPDKVHVG